MKIYNRLITIPRRSGLFVELDAASEAPRRESDGRMIGATDYSGRRSPSCIFRCGPKELTKNHENTEKYSKMLKKQG